MRPSRDAEAARKEPSLGVVIPTFDEERQLGPLLERLLGVTAGDGALPCAADADRADRPERVVVADGGSRDGTAAFARARGAELVVGERGRGAQLAAGAQRLDCELLLFLHADCVPAPGALTLVRRAFVESPELAACALHQEIEAHGLFYRLVEACADARVRLFGMVYGDSGLCVRRAAYEAVGGFRPLPLFEDVDLSRRLGRLGKPRLLRAAALRVSPRRWQREGALRATLRNWSLTLAYAVGASPERLARYYAPHSMPEPPP